MKKFALSPMIERKISKSAQESNTTTDDEDSSVCGLSYKSIVPCFISNHVKNFCDTTCQKNWNDALYESSLIPEPQSVESTTAESIFAKKMQKTISEMKPHCSETFAAVVMADVSGYSNLSATLAEKGAEGAEILSKTMKGYLDKIIGVILKHEGDITRGICDPSESNVSDEIGKGETVLKAAHCCLELLKILGSYEVEIPDIGKKILRIHLGIGAGNVYDVMVGGLGRWEHFISGDAVNQLASVLDLAKAGELALSHQALKCFSSIVDVASVGIGSYDKRCIILTGLETATRKPKLLNKTSISSTAKESPHTAKKYLTPNSLNLQISNFIEKTAPIVERKNQAVRDQAVEFYQLFVNPSALCKLQTDINQSRLFRVDAGLIDLMSLRESRQITTIFIRIGSLTKWENEATLNSAQEAMTIVQKALKKYEGSLRQKHVDDKGATILIFFGLPPLAHENDASFGMKAALEICDQFINVFDDFSIGLTTGMVSIGGVGNQNRIEYAVMGDAINMAARLMCNKQADKTILCDEKTYNLCESEFIFDALGQIKVKGKSHPISIYRPKCLKSSKLKSEPSAFKNVFVGREKERTVVQECLKSHKATVGPHFLGIEAEGGLGLSTFSRWINSEAESEGLIVSFGKPAQVEKSTRYFVWRDIFQDILNAIEFLPENKSRATKLSENRAPMFLMTLKEDKKNSAFDVDKTSSSSKKSKNPKGSGSGNRNSANLSNQASKKPATVSEAPIKLSGKPRNVNGQLSVRHITTEKDAMGHASSLEILNTFCRPSGIEGGQKMDKKWHNLEDRMRKLFIKVGEAPSQVGLMNLIFPFDFQQTEVYTKLQGKFRINELTDLFRRIINFITSESSKSMTIIIHEAQWLDQPSWELLWELGISCPKLMICINSRPEKYYDSEETKSSYVKFRNNSHTEKIVLGGFSIEDTSRLIVSNWHIPISKVEKILTENIYRKTNGSPLYIKSVIMSLKEAGHLTTQDNELKILSKEFDFQKNLSVADNIQSVITAQLDRLDANFYLFLKVVSVLAQPFLIEEASALLQDTPCFKVIFGADNSPIDQVLSKIKSLDKYEYLSTLDDISSGAQMQFKSSVVLNSIYTMMLHSQRQQLHLNVAMYYEKIISAGTQQRLVISLYEHYSKADEKYLMKKLTYLEIFASYCFEKNLIGESIKHFVQLIDEVEIQSKKRSDIIFDRISISTWHRSIGEAYFIRGEHVNAEKHLLESLKISNRPFPANWITLMLKTRTETNIRSNFPILLSDGADLTSNIYHSPINNNNFGSEAEFGDLEENFNLIGSNVVMEDKLKFDPSAIQLLEFLKVKSNLELHNVRRAMAALATLYLNTGRYNEHVYAVLVGTNISEQFPRDSLYAKFMSMCSEISWILTAKKRDALKYLESAAKHDLRFDLTQTVSIVIKSALVFFLMGKWGSSIRRLALLPALEMMSGDFMLRLEVLRMRSIIIHLCGARPQSLKAARSLNHIANQEGHWEGKFWGCHLMISNFLTTNKGATELAEQKKKLDVIWSNIPDNLKNDPILALSYLVFSSKVDFRTKSPNFQMDEFAKSLSKIASDIRRKPGPFDLRGASCNSFSGPIEWMPLVSLIHAGSLISEEFAEVPITKASTKRYISATCDDFTKWLETGRTMKQMAAAEPIKYLFHGIKALMASKVKAVKMWKKGLACRRISDLLYVRGIVFLLVATHSQDRSESNHNAHESQKIFSRIGATVEFEQAKGVRKDRDKKKKSGEGSSDGHGSLSDVHDMDDNAGESIFEEQKSIYGDKSMEESFA